MKQGRIDPQMHAAGPREIATGWTLGHEGVRQEKRLLFELLRI